MTASAPRSDGARAGRAREEPAGPGCGELLSILRSQPQATRAELAARTGMARSTVGQRLAMLSSLGLVAPAGLQASTGGRPPASVRFAEEAGVILAADVGATHCRLAVMDLGRSVLVEESGDLAVADGPDPVLGHVRSRFGELLERSGHKPSEVMGIGIGLPGPVEFATGRPVNPPIMPGWDGVRVPEYFADLGAPVLVDNDVNIMAVGEHGEHWGGFEDFLLVKVGTGIGCGIISRGRLHRGAQGAAGDIGHIRVIGSDVRCHCGNRGCLEAVAGGGALARALAGRGLDTRDSRDVVRAVRAREPEAVRAVRDAGRAIGDVLASLVNFFNPSILAVGGDVVHAGDELLAGLREVVYQRSLTLATRELQVTTARLDDQAGITGAAAMVADALFEPARVDALAAGRIEPRAMLTTR